MYCLTVIVLDKFRGGRELVHGCELAHHHYTSKEGSNPPKCPYETSIGFHNNGQFLFPDDDLDCSPN